MTSITFAIISLACAVVWSGTPEAKVHETYDPLAAGAFLGFAGFIIAAVVAL